MLTLSRYDEAFEHPGISEGVLLYPGKIQELGNTLIDRTRHLVKDRRFHQSLGNLNESVARKKAHLERETEEPAEAELPSVAFELVENRTADSLAAQGVGYGDSAHLAEVGPHGVQRTTPDHGAVSHGNDKLLHRLVELNLLLAEQNVLLNQWMNQRQNIRHVRGTGTPHQNASGCHNDKASWCP